MEFKSTSNEKKCDLMKLCFSLVNIVLSKPYQNISLEDANYEKLQKVDSVISYPNKRRFFQYKSGQSFYIIILCN